MYLYLYCCALQVKIYMSLLYACSLSLYIEGTQPNEVIYYTNNSLRDDIVSKWILNTAKKKKTIDKAYIADSTAVTNSTTLTVRNKIILKRQKTDDEPVIYVDNPVEARLPCRWIRRSMLREVIKQRGKGNVKDNAKIIEDLTKLCRSQTEVIKKFKARLPKTTREPTVVVENPVEANIACPLISRSKLMTIILNRAKDNANGIVKTAEDSVFFRLPMMCATEQGVLQIEGDTAVKRPLRNTCTTSLHQVTPTTPRNTLEFQPSTTNYTTIFSSKSRNASEPIGATKTMPIARKATTLTVPSTTPVEIIKLYVGNLSEFSIIDTDIPTATQRNVLEPDLTSSTTTTTTSLISSRGTIEHKEIVSIDANTYRTTQINYSANSDTRVSTSQRNSIETVTLSASANTGRLKTSQRNTFEPTISNMTTNNLRSSTSQLNTFDLIQLTTSAAVDYGRTITTPSINFQPIVTNTNVTTTSRILKDTSKPSVIHATKLSSILNLFTAVTRKKRIKRTKTHKNRRVKTTTEPSFSHGHFQY